MNMRVAITGATGFIGSHVAVGLARAGHQVVATGRNPSKVPALGDVPGIELRRGELNDPFSWSDCLERCDALIHIALGWGETGLDMLRNDTEASLRLFQAAVEAGIKRIVYTSSTAACGEMSPLNREDMLPRPVDFYGATKAATESYLRAFGHKHGISVHVVRPGYVFGEPVVEGADSQPDKRFRDICRAVAKGDPVHLLQHDGTQFLHVQDISRIYLALLSHPVAPSVHYALSNQWRSWVEVAEIAGQIAEKTPKIVLEDRGYGATPYLFDVSALEKDFGLAFGNLERIREHVRWELSSP